jgi:DNA-directed RNA polymerase specialized sigma24 family protein
MELLVVDQSKPSSTETQQAAYDMVLSHLTVAQKEALEARLNGLAYSKCAELLGISIRSVRTREERALLRLRALAESFPEVFDDIAGGQIDLED